VNDPQAVLAVLESSPALLVPMLQEIPEPLRKQRPIPGKWSAHEHLCHLAAFQAVLSERLERMLAEEAPPLTPYYPSAEEQAGSFLGLDTGEVMDRFTRERAAFVARLRELPPEGWERTGYHPEMPGYTVFRLARHAALHDLLHGYRMEEVLYKQDWPAPGVTEEPGEAAPRAPVPAAEGLAGLLPRLRAGEVNVFGPFEVPELPARHLRLYIPWDYAPDREGGNFALYMFDGQNVFDDGPSFSGGWYIHEAAERLARAGRPVPVIVGIDHGGESRVLELSPFPWEGKPGQISVFLDWITGTLMPVLQRELALRPGPLGAVVGGSSMGGLAALWSHFHYPHAFGGALAMSPSLWLADQAIFADLAEQPDPEVSRIYLDMGAREDKGRMLPIAAAMAAHLAGRGWDSDRLLWRPDAKGGHNEASWRRRLPKALRFLYR
jgi:predicted alpha/beta superfamily hydrolase